MKRLGKALLKIKRRKKNLRMSRKACSYKIYYRQNHFYLEDLLRQAVKINRKNKELSSRAIILKYLIGLTYQKRVKQNQF